MSFALWCLILGTAAWAASYLLKALFVNRSDADNPIRALVAGIGYLGLAAIAWGAVIIAFSFA